MISLVSGAMIDNLQGYWTCNQTGNTLNDELGVHNGANNGATASASGIVGTSYQYSPNDYVDMSDAFNDELNGNDFTISVWFYPTSNNQAGVFVSKPAGSDRHTGIWWENGKATLSLDTGGDGSGTYATTTSTKSLNAWHHVVATYDISTGLADLWIDGVKEASGVNMGIETIESGITVFGRKGGSSANYFTGNIDEAGIWDRILTDKEITRLYNRGSGVTYPEFASDFLDIILNTPPDDYFIAISNQTFNATITPYGSTGAGLNITNASIYIWYSNGSLFNVTTNVLLGNETNSTEWNIVDFAVGENYEWTVYSEGWNGTGTVKQWSFENRTLTAGSFTEEFDPILIEGEDTDLNINITFDNIDTSILSTLYWNNTAYTPTKSVIGSDTVIFTVSLTVPLDSGTGLGNNISHYWNYYKPDLSLNQNTTPQNQTVYEVDADDCTTYSILILNYTMYDEETRLLIDGESLSVNGTIGIDVTFYNLDRSLVLKEFSQVFSPNYSAIVCMNGGILGNTSLSMDTVVSYEAEGYVKEFHYFDNHTLTADIIPIEIGLYPLLLTDSTTVLLEYTDDNGLPVEDAVIQIERRYVGSGTPSPLYIGVERSKQDQNGQTQAHLVEEDVIYRFRVFLNGVQQFLSSDYNVRCLETPCTIKIKESSEIPSFDSEYDQLPEGTYSITVNKANRNVTLAFNLETLGTMNLTIYEIPTGENLLDFVITSGQLTANSGSITLHIPQTYDNRTFYAVVFHDGEYVGSQYIDLTADASDYFGKFGLFLGALVVLAIALIGLSQGELVVIWTAFGVIVAGALYLYNLNWFAMIGICAVAIMFIIKLSIRNKTR